MDEISKETLGSYVNKATDDVFDKTSYHGAFRKLSDKRSSGIAVKTTPEGEKRYKIAKDKHMLKLNNRMAGIKKANSKLPNDKYRDRDIERSHDRMNDFNDHLRWSDHLHGKLSSDDYYAGKSDNHHLDRRKNGPLGRRKNKLKESAVSKFNDTLTQILCEDGDGVLKHHHDQAHHHNNKAKEAHDLSLNHDVESLHPNKEDDEMISHKQLSALYKKISQHHATLAAHHGKKHDELKRLL